MMDVLVRLIIKDFQIVFRKKQVGVVAFLLPLLCCIAAYPWLKGDTGIRAVIKPIQVILIDQEDSVISRMLIQHYKGNKSFSTLVTLICMPEEEARYVYAQGDTCAIVRIPPNFSNSLYYLENKPIEVKLNPLHPFQSFLLKQMMNSYSGYIEAVETNVVYVYDTLIKAGLSPKKASAINDEVTYDMVTLAMGRNLLFEDHPIKGIPAVASSIYFVVGLSSLFLIYTGFVAAVDILDEKRHGGLFRMQCSPIPVHTLIGSKLFSWMCVMSLQSMCIFLGIKLVYGAVPVENLLAFVLFFALCIFTVCAIAAVLATLANTSSQVVLVGNLGMLICGILGGSFIPIKWMPHMLQTISKWMPNYWMIRGMLFAIKGEEVAPMLPSIAVLSVVSAVCIIIAAYRFSVGSRCCR